MIHGALCALWAVGLLSPVLAASGQKPSVLPPELYMSTPELIRAAGFGAEVHEVRTRDGYLLAMHRLLPRANASSPAHRTPVVLGNGLGACSESWVARQDSDNVVFLLNDNGFDTWLVDYRGSSYSSKHVNLSSKSHEYWDFSWHENGVYDLAAAIDYVLAKTGHSSLFTMGHSMGSTTQIVLLSERPEYARKVRAAFLLAPAVYFSEPLGLASLLNFLPIRSAYSKHVVNDQFPVPVRNEPGHRYFSICFTNTKVMASFCRAGFRALAGKFNQPMDLKMSWAFTSHFPCGSSIRQVMHYQQVISQHGEFRKYDYGAVKNREIYGSDKPPLYNLSRIQTPIHMFYSNTDNLVSTKDVEKLVQDIPKLERLYKVPQEFFNHFDYFTSVNGVKELNKIILEDLNKYL